MNNKAPSSCLVLNSKATGLELVDAINERLGKASGVLDTLLANDHIKCLNPDSVIETLAAVSGLIDESKAMVGPMWETVNKEKSA